MDKLGKPEPGPLKLAYCRSCARVFVIAKELELSFVEKGNGQYHGKVNCDPVGENDHA